MSDILHYICLATDYATGELLEESIPCLGIYPTSYFEKGEDIATLSLYSENAQEIDEARKKINEALADWADFVPLDKVELLRGEMMREDWTESWKKFFHVSRISKRLTIKPSWEEYTPGADEIVLEIDPGMSFGTGQHGTTRACLQFLDEIQEEMGSELSFLDAGTGSGILSMAAAKLGYTPLKAFDYDPEAVRCTRENLQLSGCGNQVELSVDDITNLQLQGEFDVIAANILAVILQQCSAILCARLKKKASSRLLLSGILTSQYPQIVETFEAAGLREIRSVTLDEWTSGLFAWR